VSDIDARVRLAAFEFLEATRRRLGSEGAFSRALLAEGFIFEGQRVPLIAPQGIFKPRVLPEIPLSITTVPIVEGQERPYEDVLGADGRLQYRYRGLDPFHRDNVGLRLAMQRQIPLIYFQGIVPGLYEAAWPVYIVGDDPAMLTFTVSVDEGQFVSLGTRPDDPEETDLRRRYATRIFQQRLHQTAFRERVLEAYERHCAVCRLRRDQFLEAAHILPDKHPSGEPLISNGLALCKLHHAAFDSHIIGIRPDCTIEVRDDVLNETDGPMLIHGLQGFHNKTIGVPKRPAWRPNSLFLEERYSLFKRAG
jgi:putative restriction endonuclease